MKSLVTLIILSFSLSVSARAQQHSTQASMQSSQGSEPLVPGLLTAYFEIKNALVVSDATTASTAAAQFTRLATSVDVKTIPETERRAFLSLKTDLIRGAEKISFSKALADQRAHFATLSAKVWEFAKASGYKEQSVYQMYCPMKKAYWLSQEKEVKNPYYGQQMLTCGKVSATL